MDKEVKKILEDIYAIDDSLKRHEKELIVTINKLIASRPSVEFDENFRSKLRVELLEKFSQKKDRKFNFNYMNKLYYVFGALVLVLIIMVPTLFKQGAAPSNKLAANIEFALEVDKVGKGAFGSLRDSSANVPQGEVAAIGLGGGGGGAVTDSKMISTMPYQPINYKYVYQGEEFSVDGNQMAVLKKVKGLASQDQAARILQSLKFDNINLASFNNSQLRNFTIYEDKDFGYSIYVDLYDGIISINEYWERWPMSQVANSEEAGRPIQLSDIPADDKLIAMANKFLEDKNISREGYGEPIVDNSWRQAYLKVDDQDNYPIPEIVNIVYPSVIDGKAVYEEWGNVQGLRVAINLRYDRVVNVWNLSSNKYQSSLYDMETDVNKILELASRGGSYYPIEGGSKTIEVTIGTPHIAYVQIWHYENNMSNQLLVPALVFPVLNIPDEAEYFYRENVIIPLAKDIVSQRLELY